MINRMLTGARYVRLGFGMWRDKDVFPYWIIPNLVNAVLFAIMGYILIDYGGGWIASWTEWGEIDLPSWLSWLQGVVDFLEGLLAVLLWALLGITFLMILATTFSLFTQLIMAPFLALLSEKVESQFRELDYPELTLGSVVKRSFKREIQKMIYILLRLIGLFIVVYVLGLIPLINFAVPVIWFMYNGWMKAIEFTDFAADNNGVEFKEMLVRLNQDKWHSVGFGCAVYFTTLIPIVNLMALPVAVAGATRLWVDKLDARSPADAAR